MLAWEISNKVRIGKWPHAEVLAKRFVQTIDHYGMIPLAVTLEHALLAGSMLGPRRDPFDRMLAAQAIAEDIPLVTADPAFRSFAVRTIW